MENEQKYSKKPFFKGPLNWLSLSPLWIATIPYIVRDFVQEELEQEEIGIRGDWDEWRCGLVPASPPHS